MAGGERQHPEQLPSHASHLIEQTAVVALDRVELGHCIRSQFCRMPLHRFTSGHESGSSSQGGTFSEAAAGELINRKTVNRTGFDGSLSLRYRRLGRQDISVVGRDRRAQPSPSLQLPGPGHERPNRANNNDLCQYVERPRS
jgi:hypothetical protein